MSLKPRAFQIQPPKSWLRFAKKARPTFCPDISCLTVAVSGFRDDNVGWCVGVTPEAEDLDCILACFNRHDRGDKVELARLGATPTEALEIANDLMVGSRMIFDTHPDYGKDRRRLRNKWRKRAQRARKKAQGGEADATR